MTDQSEAEAAVERLTELAARIATPRQLSPLAEIGAIYSEQGAKLENSAVPHSDALALDLRLLLAERRGLREALEPFVKALDDAEHDGAIAEAQGYDPNDLEHARHGVTLGDFRRARSALQGKGGAANPPS